MILLEEKRKVPQPFALMRYQVPKDLHRLPKICRNNTVCYLKATEIGKCHLKPAIQLFKQVQSPGQIF